MYTEYYNYYYQVIYSTIMDSVVHKDTEIRISGIVYASTRNMGKHIHKITSPIIILCIYMNNLTTSPVAQ